MLNVDDLYRRGGEYEYAAASTRSADCSLAARDCHGAASASSCRRCVGFMTMPGSSALPFPAYIRLTYSVTPGSVRSEEATET